MGEEKSSGTKSSFDPHPTSQSAITNRDQRRRNPGLRELWVLFYGEAFVTRPWGMLASRENVVMDELSG